MAIQTFTPFVVNDGAIINGVAHFVRATKPTVRADGAALVIGDRWYNPSTGNGAHWNGTYWLSPPIVTPLSSMTSGNFGASSSNAALGIINTPPNDLLVKEVHFLAYNNAHFAATTANNHLIINVAPLVNTGNFGSTWASCNLWSGVGESLGRSWAGYTNIGEYSLTIPLGDRFVTGSKTIAAFPTLNQLRGLRFTVTLVGSNPGGTLTINTATIVYHLIYD